MVRLNPTATKTFANGQAQTSVVVVEMVRTLKDRLRWSDLAAGASKVWRMSTGGRWSKEVFPGNDAGQR